MDRIEADPRETTERIAIELGDSQVVYLAIERPAPPSTLTEETEIAARRITLDSMLGGLVEFSRQTAERLRDANASSMSVEFGCDFALESGTLVAVIGRVAATSSIRIRLKWRPGDEQPTQNG
jgi:Trypsin-co-occurring domain 1